MKRLLLGLALAAVHCSDGDIAITGPDGQTLGGCQDEDGDGYGTGCRAGVDCDDGDNTLQADCSVNQFGAPWDTEGSSGVAVDENGDLTLREDSSADDTVWIANSEEGTVSKLDAPSGRELARYPSVLAGGNDARPWNERCDQETQGNCPSRTAIDFRRDCWVANRAFSNQGTVTKIASRLEECVDRNANGMIDTSSDADGNGHIELGEIVGDDECILFTVNVGGENGIPRALAVAPDTRFVSTGGNAWVGTNTERMAYEVNGVDGTILRTVSLPLNPYGALAGKALGLVWFVNAGWQEAPDNPPGIAAVEFATGVVHPRQDVQSTIDCDGTYGISLDGQGRVWTGGYPCESIFRYTGNADVGTWMSVALGGRGMTRGLVGAGDGKIWVAHSTTTGGESIGMLSSVDEETGEVLSQHTLPTGIDTIGVDLDRQGNIWSVSRESNNAAKLNPATGAIQEFTVGAGPYTYSDFTGHSLRLQFPQGTYSGISEACGEAGATWRTARWEGDVPEGTSISVRVRTAASREALAQAQWYGPWTESPADLQASPGPVPQGSFLEFEISLVSIDGFTAPHLSNFSLTYSCALQ